MMPNATSVTPLYCCICRGKSFVEINSLITSRHHEWWRGVENWTSLREVPPRPSLGDQRWSSENQMPSPPLLCGRHTAVLETECFLFCGSPCFTLFVERVAPPSEQATCINYLSVSSQTSQEYSLSTISG